MNSFNVGYLGYPSLLASVANLARLAQQWHSPINFKVSSDSTNYDEQLYVKALFF